MDPEFRIHSRAINGPKVHSHYWTQSLEYVINSFTNTIFIEQPVMAAEKACGKKNILRNQKG